MPNDHEIREAIDLVVKVRSQLESTTALRAIETKDVFDALHYLSNTKYQNWLVHSWDEDHGKAMN